MAWATPKVLAQITFTVTSLPHQIGEYYCGYYSTNISPNSLIGQIGGPQEWDFSLSKQIFEAPHRFDLVAVDNSGYGFDFPKATYSERETDESVGEIIVWSNYSLDSGTGRSYYGFVVPTLFSNVAFSNATVDIPPSVQFGQTWSRSVDYDYFDLNDFAFHSVHFSNESSVDAYGSTKLTAIGFRPALRVREVHLEDDYDLFTGDYLYSMTNIYYYWLVENVGITAEVTLFSQNPQLSPLPFTNACLRTFATSLLTPVDGLKAQVFGANLRLTWAVRDGANSYQVEYSSDVSADNWNILTSSSTNTCHDTITSAQRFYRVYSIQ
jgi:hypothetical protein